MASGFNLGNAYGEIIIKDNIDTAVSNASRSFDRGLTNMGKSLDKLGKQMQSVGTSLTVLTAPLAVFGATGINTATKFQDSLVEISARTGLVGDELERVKQIALQLGAETVFSGQQVIDAFLQMLTAGIDVGDAIEMLPEILNAAAAAGTDLGTAADLVTNVMSVFQLEAKDATAVVEAMSRAAASSPASMVEIAEAMQSAGGVAKNMGIDMEQTAAIMAIFARSGIRGSEAGTQLRSMLLNLQRPTQQVKDAYSELGVSLFTVDGSARNFDEVLQELFNSMANKSAEDQSRLMATLAGSYGIVGFNALDAGISIADMQEIMASQASASEVAAARMDTFSGAADNLAGAFETLQIEVLTPFMDNVLKPLILDVTEIISKTTEWAKENEPLVQRLIALGGVLIVVGPALIAIGVVLSSLGTILTTVGGLIAFGGKALTLAFGLLKVGALALLTPMGAVVAAGVAIGVAVYLLRDKFSDVFNWIGENVINPFIDKLQGVADKLREFLGLGESQEKRDQRIYSLYRQAGLRIGMTDDELTYFEGRISSEGLGNVRTIMTEMGLTGDQQMRLISYTTETRDSGGHGVPGVPYMIGTGAQPELFIPSSPGTFIPRDQWMGTVGGGGNTTYNVTVPIMGDIGNYSPEQIRSIAIKSTIDVLEEFFDRI